jgi:hypothetical protein
MGLLHPAEKLHTGEDAIRTGLLAWAAKCPALLGADAEKDGGISLRLEAFRRDVLSEFDAAADLCAEGFDQPHFPIQKYHWATGKG